MAKFGELIDQDKPVLIYFYSPRFDKRNLMTEVLNEVAEEMNKRARLIKIDVDKNGKLAEALKIESVPTFVIYRNSEMVWRKSGPHSVDDLITAIETYS